MSNYKNSIMNFKFISILIAGTLFISCSGSSEKPMSEVVNEGAGFC